MATGEVEMIDIRAEMERPMKVADVLLQAITSHSFWRSVDVIDNNPSEWSRSSKMTPVVNRQKLYAAFKAFFERTYLFKEASKTFRSGWEVPNALVVAPGKK